MPTYIQIMDAFSHFMTWLFPSVPTYFRLIEAMSCSLTDFLPYLLLVVYPFLQKYFVKGLTVGAVKG